MSRRSPYDRTEINFSKLILCEGTSDEAFIRNLLSNRALGDATVRNTMDAGGNRSGSISLFGQLLLAASAWRGFADLKGILIIGDSDIDPQKNFENIKAQIEMITPEVAKSGINLVAPLAINTPSVGIPPITILTLPWIDQPGNLEALCVPSAMATTQHAAHVEAFGAATGASNWPSANAVAKFRMRAILAVSNQIDPAIGMGNLWRDNPDALVPLGHESFNQIADALAAFLNA